MQGWCANFARKCTLQKCNYVITSTVSILNFVIFLKNDTFMYNVHLTYSNRNFFIDFDAAPSALCIKMELAQIYGINKKPKHFRNYYETWSKYHLNELLIWLKLWIFFGYIISGSIPFFMHKSHITI